MFPLVFVVRLFTLSPRGRGLGRGGACHSKLPLTALVLCLTRAWIKPLDSVQRKAPSPQPFYEARFVKLYCRG